MSKIFPIIRREYVTRVRKRTFIIMSIVGPLLFAALLIAPYKLANMEDSDRKTIALVELGNDGRSVPEVEALYKNAIAPRENLNIQYLPDMDTTTINAMLEYGGYDGILLLKNELPAENEVAIDFYTSKQPGMNLENYLRQSLENYLFEKKLQELHISSQQIEASRIRIHLQLQKFDKGSFKEQNSLDLKRGLGYAAGFLVYFFIFFFGAQVMRGVIEEKTNRIVEVIITSVRPFELMMGKIVGIALVGLTQFLAWIVFTLVIYLFAQVSMFESPQLPAADPTLVSQGISQGAPAVMQAFESMGFGYYLYLLGCFVFYFILGYLLYGSLFAAIGSAVDSETDTQQFMLPVTLPLIFSIIVMISAITNPESSLAFWFSMIPLTSPVVMMARIPFGIAAWELVSSMVILVVTFLAVTWVAGKIYRTGILLYGSKVSYRDIIRWIRFKG